MLSSCFPTNHQFIEETGFIVNLNSPSISIGTIEMQTDKILGVGLNKLNADVAYYPDEDAVCMSYKHEFYNYKLFWSYEGREAFINALDTYKVDYENRKLNKNSLVKKTRYGRTPAYLGWQSLAFLFQYRAKNEITLGYYFKSRAPYFAVTQKPAEFIDKDSNINNAKSAEQTMYFTRAQADVLAVLFDPVFLRGLDLKNLRRISDVDVDVY